MKKIISALLLVIFVSTNFSFAFIPCNPVCNLTTETCDTNVGMCKPMNTSNTQWSAVPSDECIAAWGTYSNNTCTCPNSKIYDLASKTCITAPTTINTNNTWNTDPVMGISCSEDQLVNGQCKLNIYDTLGIRKSVRNTGDPTSVGLFVQDVVLSATFFIGTLVTVALIVSGLMFIFAASSGKDPANAKKGIIGSLVGLLIVVSSYVIIRLVQYIAKGF